MTDEKMSYGSADSELPPRMWVTKSGVFVIGPLKTTHNMHYATVTDAGDLSFFASSASLVEPPMTPLFPIPKVWIDSQAHINNLTAIVDELEVVLKDCQKAHDATREHWEEARARNADLKSKLEMERGRHKGTTYRALEAEDRIKELEGRLERVGDMDIHWIEARSLTRDGYPEDPSEGMCFTDLDDIEYSHVFRDGKWDCTRVCYDEEKEYLKARVKELDNKYHYEKCRADQGWDQLDDANNKIEKLEAKLNRVHKRAVMTINNFNKGMPDLGELETCKAIIKIIVWDKGE